MSSTTGYPLNRRAFLKLAGVAGAAVSCSPPAGPQKLIPYLVPPEQAVPGVPLLFRTACRECPAGCGVTARTREGRVVKLEGDPDDPIGRGALCARGQAAVQDLYAPDRFPGPRKRGPDGALAAVSWDDGMAALVAALQAAKAAAPAGGVRLLTRPEPGGVGALQRQLMLALGVAPEHRLVLEPADPTALRAAGGLLFSRPELPVFDLSAARTVVSFGADLVESWLSPVELARGLASGRGKGGSGRTRLVWVGPRLSLSGIGADRWLNCRSGSEAWVALGLLRWLCDPANRVAELSAEAPELFRALATLDLAQVEQESGVAAADIAALGAELATRRPSALLGPGLLSSSHRATTLAVAVQLVNQVLGNLGRTVLYGLDPLVDPPSPLAAVRALLADAAAGRVKLLLLHHADPVGALPAALAADAALSRVATVVSFASRPDASCRRAHLVLPDHHPLESFGDLEVRRGVVRLAQPAMTPLHDTRGAAQVLLDLLGQLPPPSGPPSAADPFDLLQSRLAVHFPGLADEALAEAQRKAQMAGGVYQKAEPVQVTLKLPAPELLVPAMLEPDAEGSLDLVLFPTALRRDGGGAPAPWLREVPDAVTTVSWTSWAELAPETARRLGVQTGDLLALTTAAATVELPAYVYPGLREGAVAVPLGDGEALALLPVAVDAASGGLAWQGERARVSAAGRRVHLPRLEGSPYQEWREVVRTVDAAAPALPPLPEPPAMYPVPEFPKHRWAMAVDLDRCTGCQACVVACYAENNVPVVGSEAMVRGRNMAWIRLERFFSQDRHGLRVDPLLMLCQHCTNAPCEPVCPVYATYTNDEGLNAQVYNRCVGTRYCSNNCPYKVRVFNWLDPSFPEPLELQLNPDVTVRSKGVMEKCTFCVQRIRAAELEAEGERRSLRDGEVVPACAQTCPARAITFGDASDPGSRVAELRRDPRGYAVLGETNTRPAITYLARIRQEES